jgi:HlyD family secretion protein
MVISITMVVLAICGYGAFHFSRRGSEDIPVKVDNVVRRNLTETVVANGKIQPVTQVLISPEVAGEIIALPVLEGQRVKRGDLLLQIKPDTYRASRNSAEANYKFALGSRRQAEAELEKAENDYHQHEELSKSKLIPASTFVQFKTAYEVAKLRLANSIHQVDQAKFALEKAEEDLSKTTISAPIDGTITRLKSQLGERVLGTSFNMGTEMMTIAQLDEMEARVDIGEIDIVLIAVGQNVQLEVDAFKDRKFNGTVTAIANASKGASMGGSSSMSGLGSQSQEAPKFEVKIRINDKETFRPGMSVTAEIETRTRNDVLTVPIQSVTTRLPKSQMPASNRPGEATPQPTREAKKRDAVKPQEVVFLLDGDRAKMVPVKIGISDSDFYEITSGLTEGQKIISGSFKAISKDLEDGKRVKIEAEIAPTDKALK